jgi:hypothetical protein
MQAERLAQLDRARITGNHKRDNAKDVDFDTPGDTL